MPGVSGVTKYDKNEAIQPALVIAQLVRGKIVARLVEILIQAHHMGSHPRKALVLPKVILLIEFITGCNSKAKLTV